MNVHDREDKVMRASALHRTALLAVLLSTASSEGQVGQPPAGQSITEDMSSFPNIGPLNQSFSGQIGLSPRPRIGSLAL